MSGSSCSLSARIPPSIPDGSVEAYQPYWAARAHLCESLGRSDEARVAFDAAIRLVDDDAVRRSLEREAEGPSR